MGNYPVYEADNRQKHLKYLMLIQIKSRPGRYAIDLKSIHKKRLTIETSYKKSKPIKIPRAKKKRNVRNKRRIR